jgi:hypothetical protein
VLADTQSVVETGRTIVISRRRGEEGEIHTTALT